VSRERFGCGHDVGAHVGLHHAQCGVAEVRVDGRDRVADDPQVEAAHVAVASTAGMGGRYCYYGARSESQLEGCQSHVTRRQGDLSSRNDQ
jgi:hypothetical protein